MITHTRRVEKTERTILGAGINKGREWGCRLPSGVVCCRDSQRLHAYSLGTRTVMAAGMRYSTGAQQCHIFAALGKKGKISGRRQVCEKGKKYMKSDGIAKNAAYIGAGAGVALFAVIGLLPGSLIGGSIGIKIAGMLFGSPVTSQLLPRMTVALFMLMGVFLSGSLFVACGAMAGWVMGNMIDAYPVHAYFTGRRKPKKARGSASGKQDSDKSVNLTK